MSIDELKVMKQDYLKRWNMTEEQYDAQLEDAKNYAVLGPRVKAIELLEHLSGSQQPDVLFYLARALAQDVVSREGYEPMTLEEAQKVYRAKRLLDELDQYDHYKVRVADVRRLLDRWAPVDSNHINYSRRGADGFLIKE